ncbi:MAG: hypothetical protein AcusKO_04420 [Acuticoccus sp.]
MARRRRPLLNRQKTAPRPREDAPGWVYIAVNDHLPDLIKIGRSADPARRMVELSGASGVPGSFVVAHTVRVADMRATEAQMHRRFAAHRVRGSEFFRMGVREARRALDRAARRSALRLVLHDWLTGGLWRGLAAGTAAVLVALGAMGLETSRLALAGLLAALLFAGALRGGRTPAPPPARRGWAGEAVAMALGIVLAAGVVVLEPAHRDAGFWRALGPAEPAGETLRQAISRLRWG